MQSIIGGATDYSEQSEKDILEDIQRWIEYTKKTKNSLSTGLFRAKELKFWNKVPFDFQMTITSSIAYCNTALSDLSIIQNAIISVSITEREVNLLHKIGIKAIEFNNEYGHTFHEDTRYWHRHSDPGFQVVEKMYQEGRDYFVCLQDATNAAARLEDYMQSTKNTNVTFNGDVNNSQIQIDTVNSTQNAGSFPYDEVMSVLQEISKNQELIEADLGDEFIEKLDSLIDITEKKGDTSAIKRGLEFLKQVATGAASSIIAKGVLAALKELPFAF